MSGDILHRLREDHRHVLGELAQLEHALQGPGVFKTAEGIGRIRGLVALLERQFATHMAAEDEVLFPTLARGLDDGPALVAPLHDEHAELQAMLATLTTTLDRPPGSARDEQIVVQLRDLSDLLRIHIRKEETLVFGIADRVLRPSERAALAARHAPERRHEDPPRTNPAKGNQP
jgi:iron-sulfur cluster repair protein YtfE (RIC family)